MYAAATALFVVAFAAAVSFVFSFPLPDVVYDARAYFALARNLSEGAGFSLDGISPVAFSPPVFSTLLGAWFKVTGTSSLLSVGIFQSFVHALGVATAFLLFVELRVRYSWACGAGLFLAANPLLVTRVVFVLQEPTVLFLTVLGTLASVRLIKAPSRIRATLTGMAWGICTLAKIVSWFAPLLLLVLSLLPKSLRWVCRRDQGALLLLCFIAVITPWTLRNYAHFERFIPVNSAGEATLEWNIRSANVPDEPSGASVVKLIRETHATPGERNSAMWRYIAQHPRYFLLDRSVRNAIHFAAPSRDWWIWRGHVEPGGGRMVFWVLVSLFHLPLYMFLLYRSWQFATGRLMPVHGFVVLFYWTYWAEHILIWGDARYGLAVYPLLVALALPTRPVDHDSQG